MRSFVNALLSCLIVYVIGQTAKDVVSHYFLEHARYDVQYRKTLLEHTQQTEQAKHGKREKV